METEVKAKTKKREWVKNAAIIFLAVLLILTFFSNTILNRSLPEVATREIGSGTIAARIRVTGTVAANQSYEVSIDESRKVRTVMIKAGQEVNVGDVLFVLSDGESDELESARDLLRDLQKSYQEKLINASDADYAKANLDIQRLRDDLAAKQEERNAMAFDTEKLEQARARVEAETQNVEDAETRVELLKTDVEAAKAGVERERANVNSAKSDVERAQDTVDQYSRELEDAQYGRDHSSESSGESGSASAALLNRVSEAEANLRVKQLELDEANNNLAAAELAYKPDLDALKASAMQEIYDDKNRGKPDNEKVEPTQQEYDNYLLYYMEKIALSKEKGDPQRIAYEKVTEATAAVAVAETARNEAQAELNSARAAVREANNNSGTYVPGKNYDGHSYSYWEKECQRIDKLLRDANTALTRAQRAQTAAENKLAEAQEKVSSAQEKVSEAQTGVTEAEVKQTEAETALREEETKQTDFENQCKDADEEIKNLSRSLEDQLVELQSQRKDDNRQAQLDNLDLQDLSGQIARQQAKVEELSADAAEKEVTASVSGVIENVAITAGQTTTPKTAMATIELPDMGYILTASVTNEQARRVHTGDTASVANMYWGTQIDAELTGVKADPKDPQNSKQLTFTLSGDVTPGSSLTLSVGQRSAEYDFVVPNSALRSDSNGDFILVVTAKNSPLGDRYTATRVNVTKVANDDTLTAVTGALNAGDFVITTSTAPVKNGDRVRLADTQT